jgi:acetyl/propionyl-CoA carboxylase alpha subunit
LITGLDLVEQQLRIARGEALAFSQEQLQIKGHALELRVYAEDPQNDFLPSIGRLERYRPPSGSGIRVDDGYREGMDIPIYYDPMLSKLIVYGADRTAALDLMIRAIDDYLVVGPETTLPFGRFVCQHPAFRSGDFDTGFVKAHFSADILAQDLQADARVAAAFAGLLRDADLRKVSLPE